MPRLTLTACSRLLRMRSSAHPCGLHGCDARVRHTVRATVRYASQAIYGDVDLAAETFDTMFKVRFACVRMRTC
jgi:hypothetical protein